MEARIKINLDDRLTGDGPVIVELGCGAKKRPGAVGIDSTDLPEVDIVADLEKGLPFLPDNSVDELHCRSLLEHIAGFEDLLAEIVRVLKPTGVARIFVPHFSNPHYYSDYSHVRPFALYSFYYFVDPDQQPNRRKVPSHYSKVRLNLISQKLVFRSSFAFLKPLKKLFGRFVNLSVGTQLYYEENLCYLCPCSGIEVVISPPQSTA